MSYSLHTGESEEINRIKWTTLECPKGTTWLFSGAPIWARVIGNWNDVFFSICAWSCQTNLQSRAKQVRSCWFEYQSWRLGAGPLTRVTGLAGELCMEWPPQVVAWTVLGRWQGAQVALWRPWRHAHWSWKFMSSSILHFTIYTFNSWMMLSTCFKHVCLLSDSFNYDYVYT